MTTFFLRAMLVGCLVYILLTPDTPRGMVFKDTPSECVKEPLTP